MAFQMNCPHCAKQLNVTEKAFGKTVPCPGCKQPIEVPRLPPVGVNRNLPATLASSLPFAAGMKSLSVPRDSRIANDNPVTRQCPHCGSLLSLVQQLYGKHVRCNACGNLLAVSGNPLRLSLVGAESIALPAEADRAQPPRTAPMTVPSHPIPPPPVQKSPEVPHVPAGSIGTGPSSRAEAEVVMFRCPICSRALQIQRQFAGKAVVYPCGCNVQVPTLPSQPAIGAEASVVAPPTVLGLLSLLGTVTVVALLSSFLATLLLGAL